MIINTNQNENERMPRMPLLRTCERLSTCRHFVNNVNNERSMNLAMTSSVDSCVGIGKSIDIVIESKQETEHDD